MILAFMVDRPGVLNKVSMLIRKKMYNIDTLTVCASNKTGVSRMSISLTADDKEIVEKMVKQIKKLIEVISAQVVEPDECFARELALLKIAIKKERLEQLDREFNFMILESTEKNKTVQIAGTISRIDEFIKEVGKENVIEIARTGPTVIEI